jgi:phosphatidylglycerophosphate synthase
MGFGRSMTQLRDAQKSSKGAPPYSLFINRPLGRIFAAAAHQLGMTPNQVTYVSAACTLAGLLVLGLGSAGGWSGLLVAVLLVLGYALDSADGQLARLRGGGSLLGEWLDHMIDSIKVAALHLVVLVMLYRNFDLAIGWLVVPICFAVVSAVHFFGMILVDLMGRVRRAEAGLPAPPKASANVLVTLAKLPTDYGILCLVFLLLGLHAAFFVVYTVLAVATAGYTLLVIGKWRRDVVALDAIGRV